MLFFKRLELQGFKSFANKTTIDFHPGVTVIVGPNGCGKSNIFDSIRWVLGEQSAKSMRGSRMGDIIFNGSGTQKATGMARANLVLNNEQRTLPVEFDEVAITRRLFRTGESEYMLNGSQCRLKDITSLCMDTGVGTDSYSVLEQGKVDAIINSRPLERRVIFDEAAGISKYKARKEEALNKLSRTEEDLLRLADIINEVRRQAGSLKRQAAKAERYKRLASELQVLEMELLVRRFFQLREGSASTEERFAELSAQVTELRTRLSAVNEETNAGRETAEEVQSYLDATHSEQFEVNTALQEAQSGIALAEQRIAQGGERRESLTKEIQNLAGQVQALDTEMAGVEIELGENESALEQLAEDYAERKRQHDTMRADTDGSGAEIQRLRQEINTATRAGHEMDNAARLARAMEQKLRDELGTSEVELTMLGRQIEELETEREERQAAAEENEQVLAALRADLEATRNALRTREGEFTAASQELEKARRSAQQCLSRHDALAEMQENFEGYYRGVRDVMLASRGGILRGITGVVSSLIQAKGEHELAIEVALGGKAQDVIVDTAENAKSAIQWLKQKGSGRATFLPLDLIEPRDNPNKLREVMSEPGVMGFATDLVKHDPAIAPAVRYLLGGVVVVASIDKAVELQRRGYRTLYASVDGDILNPHGAMTGGSTKVAGLLHRTREVKELAEQLKTLRSDEARLAAQVEGLRTEIARLRTTHEKMSSSAQSQEIEAARTRKDFEVLERSLGEKRNQLTNLSSRRGSMEAEVAGHRTTQERNTALLAELNETLRNLELDLAAAESRAGTKQRELAEFSRELNDLMIRMSTARERQSARRERVEQLKREKVRLTQIQTERQGQIERAKDQQETARGEMEGLRRRAEQLAQQARELDQRITHETQKKETIQLDLRKLGEHLQLLQRDFNQAQNQLHEVELRRTEMRTQIDNIAQQAGEKFGRGMDDIILRVLNRARGEEIDSEEPEEQTPSPANAAHGSSEGQKEFDGEGEFEDVPGPIVDLHTLELPHSPEEIAEALANLRAPEEIAGRISELRASIDSIGPVHVGAIDEYNEQNQRYEFLVAQETDLQAAKSQLAETIRKIDDTTVDLFSKAFAEIRENFSQVYRRLFGGGRADLVLTDDNGVLDSGVDIIAQPPGKKPQHISLLSGGEKALTAISLLFAIFLRKPSPFCILDEVDAPLDDKNIERFKDLVREFAQTTQFVIITHNKQTMALADTIYGITMQEQGVSRVVSLRLDELDDSEYTPREAVPA